MRIVVLDGYTLNPGDLSWDELATLGECRVYDRTSHNTVIERAATADIILTNKTELSADTLSRLPALKYIGVLATGFNVVDVDAAARRGIPVTNIPEYGTDSVAQMVFAHLLNLCHHIDEHTALVRKGEWNNARDFCIHAFPLVELAGKTMGIVGLGRIGSAVARRAHAFGMNVIAYTPSGDAGGMENVTMVDLATVFRKSDVVSLHCPLTENTRGFITDHILGTMKTHAFVINTARGQLIDEHALATALNKGRIAGAGLDVLSHEPPVDDSPLRTAKNCYITPHIAWATHEARARLMTLTCDNVRSFIAGTAKNVVNGV